MENFAQKISRWQHFFEQAGAVYKNVEFRIVNNSVSCHVIDPQAPYLINIPECCLLDASRINFEKCGYSLKANGLSAEAESVWREILDFVLSDDRINESVRFQNSFNELPENVKGLLPPIGLAHYLQPNTERQEVMRTLLRQRWMSYKGGLKLMPLLEFVNHSSAANEFSVTDIGISLSGKADSEIFVRYNTGDVFHIFGHYGFVANSISAYSLPMTINVGGALFNIHRNFKENMDIGQLKSTRITPNDSGWDVSYLLLGNSVNPDQTFNNFKVSGESIGLSSPVMEAIFRSALRTNTRWLISLLRELGLANSPAANMLRNAALIQLEVLSDH